MPRPTLLGGAPISARNRGCRRRGADGASSDIPIGKVLADLDLDDDLGYRNATLRDRYLKQHKVYSGRQVRILSGLATPPASRWRRERRIFGVPVGGRDHYPAFQFTEGKGRPKPEIARVLAKLPSYMSPWQTALWFASKNGWIEGDKAPEDALHDDMDGVLAAVADLLADEVG